MAILNLDSVLDKVYNWEKSEKGQERMNKVIRKCQRTDVRKTGAGGHVLTEKEMREYADRLVEMIRSAARSCDLPESVDAHFSSLRRGRIKTSEDGSYFVEIYFTDDLSRESLQPDKYRGVDNIIAIFNNGYPEDSSRIKAISHVSGWWHGRNTDALPFRPGLFFMQEAVNDFNETYGFSLGMHAELAEVYDSE